MSDGFSHLDEHGNARMVNVANKGVTERVAVAEAQVVMPDEVRHRLFAGDLPKGDALSVARIAAIMAAKQTSDLVPLCHPIPIDGVEVDVSESAAGATVTVTARTTAKTGIEMEAMTAASIGALTIYDMVKGLDRGVEIGSVRLLHKSGGKSGTWNR
jgi:cyclic pyranopterin phosphate synthase